MAIFPFNNGNENWRYFQGPPNWLGETGSCLCKLVANPSIPIPNGFSFKCSWSMARPTPTEPVFSDFGGLGLRSSI